MAKKKESKQSNGTYPLIRVYGKFFMWKEDKIEAMINLAKELNAPGDTVFVQGKKPITRADSFWAPSLLELLNEAMPL